MILAGQENTAGTLSSTVTTAVQVPTLPLTSVTVTVTLLGPMSAQANMVWLATTDCTPQLSFALLLMSLTAKLPIPVASSCTVKALQEIVGISSSVITTSYVQGVAVAVVPSVAVTLTVVVPTGKGCPASVVRPVAVTPPLSA